MREDERMMILRITLMDIQPPVWWEVVVPAPITLDMLHHVIQASMPWRDTHLHEFMIGGVRYEAPSDEDFGEAPNALDESRYRLADLVSQGDRFLYTYDFGDNWRHEIEVVSYEPKDGSPDTVWPTCVDGKRACPPDDCGGVSGYEELVKSLSDPEHEEHEELVRWAGRFEAELFSVPQAAAFVQAMYYTHENHKIDLCRLRR